MNALPRESTGVLIAGGGPSGLVAALLLARLHVKSIVLERNAVTDEHPKAHELNARSIEILRDAGIGEEDLATEASPMEDASRILFCRAIGEEIGRIDLLADPQRKRKYETHLRQELPYLNLSQSEFEKILVARARESDLIDLRFGHRWESCEQNDDAVVSAVAGPTPYTIQSQYLLGCDGASSPVRRAVGIEMEGPAELQSFVNAYFKTNLRDRLPAPAKLYWIIHPEFPGTFVAHHIEKRWIYAVPIFKPWEQPEDFTPEVMRKRIVGALGFEPPGLEVTSVSTWRMTAQVAESYRAGRILLVGDAAHRFPPTGGLGMNTGIADAHNLCWKLALVLKDRASANLLDTYEAERRPIAIKNCAESRLNFEKIFEVLEVLGLNPKGLELFARLMGSPPVRWLPSGVKGLIRHALSRPPYWLVGRVFRNAALRERVHRAIENQTNHFDRLGLDIGYVYERGALIPDGVTSPLPENDVADYIPSTEPGARLPHVWIKSESGRQSSHDYLSYEEFTLLLPNREGLPLDNPNDWGVRVVDTSDFPSARFPTDEALLVRPDGHVAWRVPMTDCTPDRLRRILSDLLDSPVSSSPVPTDTGDPQ